MAVRIADDTMTLEIGHRVVATARFSEHAAVGGSSAWIVFTDSARLLRRSRWECQATGPERRMVMLTG